MRALVLIAAVIATHSLGCHSSTSTAQADTARAPRIERTIDRGAIAALEDMAVFLREQREFTVEGTVTADEILDSREKVQYISRTKIEVRRPDRLHAFSTSGRTEREIFYDGSKLTIHSPQTGDSTVDAPGTLADLADIVGERFEIEFPLANLISGGTPTAPTNMIYSAIDIGPATIDGVETEHYAFRQPGLDWQIWIESGERALPRKYVLTTTDEPQAPQQVATLDWDLWAKHSASTFELAVATPP